MTGPAQPIMCAFNSLLLLLCVSLIIASLQAQIEMEVGDIWTVKQSYVHGYHGYVAMVVCGKLLLALALLISSRAALTCAAIKSMPHLPLWGVCGWGELKSHNEQEPVCICCPLTQAHCCNSLRVRWSKCNTKEHYTSDVTLGGVHLRMQFLLHMCWAPCTIRLLLVYDFESQKNGQTTT